MGMTLTLTDSTGIQGLQAQFGAFIDTQIASTAADAAAAAASAAAALVSQNSAAGSVTAAAASASSAAGSATAAAISASGASGSASAAATSATNAANSATAASGSASAASSSAGNASTSATAAAGSASAAATSASNAAATLANALTKANNLSDVANAATARSNLGAAALAGSTFTGGVTLNYSSAGVTINDTSGTNSARVNFQSAGVLRWDVGNAGFSANAFAIDRYNSSGTYVDTPITISPTSGVVTMPDGITNTPISGSTGSFTTLAASSTVSGVGFSNYLASPPAIGGTVAAAGSFTALSSTGNFTPSQTAGIVGTTTNNNANAGSVGEHVTATGTSVSLTNNTPVNITSLTLSAGDWEVSASCQFSPAATTTVNALNLGISSGVSATLPAIPFSAQIQATLTTGAGQNLVAPSQRILLASATTVYLVAQAGFGVSTMTGTGTLRARRPR